MAGLRSRSWLSLSVHLAEKSPLTSRIPRCGLDSIFSRWKDSETSKSLTPISFDTGTVEIFITGFVGGCAQRSLGVSLIDGESEVGFYPRSSAGVSISEIIRASIDDYIRLGIEFFVPGCWIENSVGFGVHPARRTPLPTAIIRCQIPSIRCCIKYFSPHCPINN